MRVDAVGIQIAHYYETVALTVGVEKKVRHDELPKFRRDEIYKLPRRPVSASPTCPKAQAD
jgi:hypothetical protein